jgi:hypothetical protein
MHENEITRPEPVPFAAIDEGAVAAVSPRVEGATYNFINRL